MSRMQWTRLSEDEGPPMKKLDYYMRNKPGLHVKLANKD